MDTPTTFAASPSATMGNSSFPSAATLPGMRTTRTRRRTIRSVFWDPRTGERIHKVEGFRRPSTAFHFRPAGDLPSSVTAATGRARNWIDSKDHRVRLLDVETKTEIPPFGADRWMVRHRKAGDDEQPRFPGLTCPQCFAPLSLRIENWCRAPTTTETCWSGTRESDEEQSSGAWTPIFPEWLRGLKSLHFTPDGRFLVGAACYSVRIFEVNTGWKRWPSYLTIRTWCGR